MIASFEHSLQEMIGLNINEAMMLCIISERKNISSGELAKEMGLAHSNTSKVLGSLEKQHLILRHTGKDDLRSMKFSISKHGEELLGQMQCEDLQAPAALQKMANTLTAL